MEFAFQADLDGVLEFLSRSDDTCNAEVVQVLSSSLRQTIDYYGKTEDVLAAVSKVLFRAWYQREGYATNFSVSRYSRGLDVKELVALVNQLNLVDQILCNLYALSPEECITILKEWIPSSTVKATTHLFLVTYCRIVFGLRQDTDFEDAIAFLKDRLMNHEDAEHLFLKILHVLRYQLMECKDADDMDYRKAREKRIHELIAAIGCTSAAKLKSVQMALHSITRTAATLDDRRSDVMTLKPSQHFSRDTSNAIRHEWTETCRRVDKETRHQQAFILICQRLREASPPMPSLQVEESVLTTSRQQLQHENEDAISSALENYLQQFSERKRESNLSQCKYWCVYTLTKQDPGWKSVLAAMVQFADIWIDDFSVPITRDAFMQLICKENLLFEFYQNVFKAVYRLTKEERVPIIGKIQALVSYYYQMLSEFAQEEQLLKHRDKVFNHMIKYYSADYQLFKDPAVCLLDVEEQLGATCNQIVRDMEDEEEIKKDIVVSWSPVLQKLAALSVLGPLNVIRTLVAQALSAKERYQMIIPVLRRLGRLTKLRGPHGSLLCDYLIQLILERAEVEAHSNLAAFVTASSRDTGTFLGHPPILLPARLATQNPGIVLDLQEFLTRLVPELEALTQTEWKGTHIHKLRLILSVLNSLTSTESVTWDDWCKQIQTAIAQSMELLQQANNPGDELVFFTADFSAIGRCISRIIGWRYGPQLPEGVNLQDLEEALLFQRRMSFIWEQYMSWRSSGMPPRREDRLEDLTLEFFTTIENDFDWRTWMLWSDLYYSIFRHQISPKPKFKIPRELLSIVHTLGDSCELFGKGEQESSDADTENGWLALFESCKLSKAFMDHLFAHKDYWIYNLMLICGHPNEDELVTRCLRKTLHPTSSLSVTEEYERLLVHFLGQLYEAVDPYELIRDYSYPVDEMRAFASRLDKSDAKVLYSVLYCIKLFTGKASERCSTQETRLDYEIYYFSGIAKAIQASHHWADLTVGEMPKQSVKRIQDATADPVCIQRNLADVTHIHGVSIGNHGVWSGTLSGSAAMEQPQDAEAASGNIEDEAGNEPQDVEAASGNISEETVKKPDDAEADLGETAVEDENDPQDVEGKTSQEPATVIIDIYYPFLDDKTQSLRALSILTLCLLCYVSYQERETVAAVDSIRVLMLQIVEGLRQAKIRQEFQQLAETQAKSRYNSWKKLKGEKKRVILRPLLDREEAQLVKSYVMLLHNERQSESILRALGLVENAEEPPQPKKRRANRSAIYCLK